MDPEYLKKLRAKLWVKVYVAGVESGSQNPHIKANRAVKDFDNAFSQE